MSSPSHATFPFPADEAASAGPLNPLDSASLPEPVIPVVDARDPTEHARKLQRSDHGQDKSSPSHVGAGRTTPSQANNKSDTFSTIPATLTVDNPVNAMHALTQSLVS